MIKFLQEEHLYVNDDGIVIPSVTQLVGYAFPDAYANVPAHVLKNKAQYGTKVHQTIEDYIKGDLDLKQFHFSRVDPNIKSALNQYQRLEKKHQNLLKIKSIEQIVDYEQRFAGTFDLLTKDNVLIDIKTTATLHKDWLALQLGLYYLALGIHKKTGYCLWIPKSSPGELVEIQVWSNEECIELLEKYEKEHSTD